MRTLISAEELRTGIAGLARRLEAHYQGQPLTIVALLNGSLLFLADLVRELRIPVEYDTLRVSAYRGEATTAGEVRVEVGQVPAVRGRHLLLLDDILDTGATLQAVRELARDWGALSVRTAVLLWKPDRTRAGFRPDDYVRQIPDVFVVGYGLDYNGQYRQLPQIVELDPSTAAVGQGVLS
jgi:hypoxanthine phosphoribosyltransferase